MAEPDVRPPGAANPLTNTRRPYNTLLITTTHDSTPVCLDVVRMTPKRNTWRMNLRQITVYDALRVGQYVDQSSSGGLEKFGEDILTSPEVKFSRLKFFWGTPSQFWCALARLCQSVTRIKI